MVSRASAHYRSLPAPDSLGAYGHSSRCCLENLILSEERLLHISHNKAFVYCSREYELTDFKVPKMCGSMALLFHKNIVVAIFTRLLVYQVSGIYKDEQGIIKH
ncbi:hypothetical protein HPP92_013455 [Vanilla planifolia]|uniref:Uncharacterized protein n=1 Tax=Vanilla planifolia TaxID=51239 RepID=A0A835V0M5_VANPL|nr:hypothetical protein HPP92_013455 [Vanilla planifolia]